MTLGEGARVERRALARMLGSLLGAELAAARGRNGQALALVPPPWPEELRLDDGPDGLGCDSLERLWLSSATNEMFHLHGIDGGASLQQEPRFGVWLDSVETAWRTEDAHVTFTTSGSTGVAKRCRHGLSRLRTEAMFLAELFADRRRIVALVPAHHIYGCLFTVLLPSHLGIEVLDAEGMSAGAVQRALRPGDLVVTFPERWRWLERSLTAWPADVKGTVSTAPCPPDLIEAMIGRGLGGMTEIYGSSETAGVATRTWPRPDYTLMPHWRFAEPFDPDRPAIQHGSGTGLALMDRIVRRGERAFTLAGRLDGMVQVGGVNVDPAEVAASIEAVPGVATAIVRLMRPSEGTRLKAFVVPDGTVPEAALRSDLEAWLRDTLPAARRPASLTFGPALPLGPLGKAADWIIQA